MIFAPQPQENETKVPTVIFVIGANGMGKTTTIGKIASRLRNELNMTGGHVWEFVIINSIT